MPAGEGPLDPRSLFDTPKTDLWFEIGFGGGEHLAWQATAHPDIGFIGVEPFLNGVASLLRHVVDGNLENVRVLQGDARVAIARLPEASVGRLFVLFPDPWPKSRHHRRRVVGPTTLDVFARALKDGAELRFATDDQGYLAWALRHVRAHPAFAWTARRAEDWRRRPADWPETRYEAKAVAAARAPTFLTFVRRARG